MPNCALTGPQSRPGFRWDYAPKKLRDSAKISTWFNRVNLELKTDIQKGRLSGQGTITGLGPRPGSLRVDLPAHFSLTPFKFVVDPKSPIEGALDAELELKTVTALLSWDTQKLTGPAQIDLKMDGNLDSPRTSGWVSVKNGRYENYITGTLIDKINSRIDAQGGDLTISSLTATDGKDGRISR